MPSLLLPLVVMLVAFVSPHPYSSSRSDLRVLPGRVELVLRCQALSVFEVTPADADGDGLLDDSELAAVRDELADYLLAHYVVRAGDASSPPLPGRVDDMAVVTFDQDALTFQQFVDTRIVFDAPPRIDALRVEMSLYATTSPQHQDACTLRWPGGETEEVRLWGGRPSHAFVAPESTRPPELLEALRDGWTHAVSGWTHLALLLSVLVAAQRLRTAMLALLALALAHAGALAFAREGLLLPSDALLAAAAPAVIALSGVATVLRRGARPVLADALLGGFVLGLREARRDSLLTAVPIDDVARLSTWISGFDVGLLAVCVGVLLVLRPLPRRPALAGARDTSLVPGYARDAVAMGCALLGTYMLSRALIG
ncbi:MAG: hypothetical protein H6825_15910 [Planctomycetes bacterium]|nr:hypothetical protein [Planctomycetota bacterium]